VKLPQMAEVILVIEIMYEKLIQTYTPGVAAEGAA